MTSVGLVLQHDNISRLQKLQNTYARVILNENRRSHVGLQSMLDSLSILMPIIDLIKYHTLVAVYKCTHGLVPSYLYNTFMQISKIHSYSTRQANLAHLYTRQSKLSKFKRSFTYRGVTFWNELPEHIRKTESLNYFKTKLTTFFRHDHMSFFGSDPGRHHETYVLLSFCVVACASVYSLNFVSL